MPEVAVPEVPRDPAYFVDCIAGAGYFESLALSAEDRERARLYQANAEREQLRGSATNIQEYLKSLNMEMTWKPFDDLGMQRIVQLINKTNQFNLTTERYGEAQVRSLMNDRNVLTWQVRLKDSFGDNGIVALLIGKIRNAREAISGNRHVADELPGPGTTGRRRVPEPDPRGRQATRCGPHHREIQAISEEEWNGARSLLSAGLHASRVGGCGQRRGIDGVGSGSEVGSFPDRAR